MTNGKVILDLCGGTGAWSRPYKEAGYDVRVITMPEFDVTRHEFGDDGKHLYFFRNLDYAESQDDFGIKIPVADIYGILAAPPCTEFSLAKNGSHRSRDFEEGMKTVDACLHIIRTVRTYGKPKFWALENPVGLLRQFIGKPKFTFYQWQFGDLGIKRTDLWGYYNEPKATVTERPDHPYFVKQYKSGKKNAFAWSAPNVPYWYKGPKLGRAALRAITPSGFAEAFFKANR